MNSFILAPLCIVLWIFILIRLRAILRQGTQKAGATTLNIWAMLFSFTITLTFMIAELIAFFDRHTFPSLSLLISNSAFLVSQYFGMAAILAGMKIHLSERITRWIRLLLGIVLIVLLLIYVFFVSKAQITSFFVPQSLPEAVFIVIVCSFGISMCVILVATQLIYFPAKKFVVMRLRTIFMVLCISIAAVFLLTRAVINLSYIWGIPLHPMIIPLVYTLLICATLLFFSLFLSKRLYARLVFLSRNIESWWAFRDLKRLVDRLLPLCPLIGNIPVENPGFLAFLRDPQHHLYHAVVVILDSKLMLAYFLTEGMKPGTHPMWEGEDDLLREAMRLNQALQAANSSNEFSDVVRTYRRVSRDLFASQKNTPAGAS